MVTWPLEQKSPSTCEHLMSAETMIVNLFLIMYQRVTEQSLLIQMSLIIIKI